MRDKILSVKHKGYEFILAYDDNSILSPREYDENVGYMLCYHPRYSLGDYDYRKENYNTFSDIKEVIDQLDKGVKTTDIIAYLPLFIYDHSGISMHWSLEAYHNDKFDTSFVGYYVLTRESMEKINDSYVGMPDDELAEIGIEMAKSEIEYYDKYLTGEIWALMWVLEDGEGDAVDSAGGYVVDGDTHSDSFKEIIDMIFDDMTINDDTLDICSFKDVVRKEVLKLAERL